MSAAGSSPVKYRLTELRQLAHSPVHEAVLHLEVIDDKRVSEVHVGYGLVQGEPLGVEGYEAVALGPLLDGFV